MSVEAQIAETASTIRHCGDYGQCFWNPNLKKVHWVGGDSDFPSRGYEDQGDMTLTAYEDAQERFLAIPGVEEIELADGWYPDEDEPGWVEISYDNSEQQISEIEWLLGMARTGLANWEAVASDPTHRMHDRSEGMILHQQESIARYEQQIAAIRAGDASDNE